jgi:hypothetical protein
MAAIMKKELMPEAAGAAGTSFTSGRSLHNIGRCDASINISVTHKRVISKL